MTRRLYTSVGELSFRENNEPYMKVDRGQRGCVVYGPYESYPPGKYEVSFTILVDDKFISDGRNFCYIDVAGDSGKVLLNRIFINSACPVHDGVISILAPFSIDTPMVLEFRLHSLGTQSFIVKYERIVTLAGKSNDKSGYSKFHDDNINQFRRYSYLGAQLTPLPHGVVIDWMDMKCLAANGEDLLLFNEILCYSSYKFEISGDVCVIDVGMNVGLASLYFARMPGVRVVHGFEPFSRPFARALDNFALNPALSSKIKPKQVGLAGTTEVLEVKCSDEHTTGTSIRGKSDGTVSDTISIQEASEALRPIIREASDNKQAVVVKMDCEGSEFAIMESLDRSKLLKKVNILMMECHSWWSPDKTNMNIVEALVANGFFVFDFIRTDRPGASLIYAGRRR